MARCAQVFELPEYDLLRKYGTKLIETGHKFAYGGRDLSTIFK